MLGCFNPILGQIWTNPIVGLKNAIYKLNPTVGFVHISPKIVFKITQHFLEWCAQKMLGCFNPINQMPKCQIWTNPTVGLKKIQIINVIINLNLNFLEWKCWVVLT